MSLIDNAPFFEGTPSPIVACELLSNLVAVSQLVGDEPELLKDPQSHWSPKKKAVVFYEKKRNESEGKLAFYELTKLLKHNVVQPVYPQEKISSGGSAITLRVKEDFQDLADAGTGVSLPLNPESAEEFHKYSYKCDEAKLLALPPTFIEGSNHRTLAEKLEYVDETKTSWLQDLAAGLVTYYSQPYRIGSDLPNDVAGNAFVSVALGTKGFEVILARTWAMRQFYKFGGSFEIGAFGR